MGFEVFSSEQLIIICIRAAIAYEALPGLQPQLSHEFPRLSAGQYGIAGDQRN